MNDGWTRPTPYEEATHAEREEIRRQELPEVFKTDELNEWQEIIAEEVDRRVEWIQFTQDLRHGG